MAKAITLRVLAFKEEDKGPWDMTVSNRNDITAYMIRGGSMMINYRGDIYKCYNITEERLLKSCPHLKR